MRRFQIAGAAVATAALLVSAGSAASAAPIIPVPTLPIPILFVCQGSLATIVGTDASQVINGTPGNDVIVARGGNDVINGLGGNDKICGGNGNDLMRSSFGNDRYSGDAGTDTIDYSPIALPVSVNLTTGTAVGHGLDAIATTENVIGSNRPDTLVGNAANNVIQGRVRQRPDVGPRRARPAARRIAGRPLRRWHGHRHGLLRGIAGSGQREPHRRNGVR